MTNSTKIKTLPEFSERRKSGLTVCSADGLETVREGTGVSPGIIIGRAFVYDSREQSVPQYRIDEKDIPAEQERFLAAVRETIAQFDSIVDRAKGVFDGDPLDSLFDVYRYMLKGSRLVRGVCSRIKTSQLNAEAAIQGEVAAIADVFAEMDDVYISARIDDIRSIGSKLVRNLLASEGAEKTISLPENAVIISNDLNAADTALLNLQKISAFVTTGGSAQSHAALLARSLGLPAVVGIPDLMRIAQTGDIIIIDGSYGKVILCPTQENITLYRKYRSDFLRWKRSLKRLKSQPSVTSDQVSIQLKGNVDLPHEVDFLLQTGADGIGLMRSEYMFLNRQTLPSEDEQFEILRQIASRIEGKPITFRTFDVGGDKCPDSLHTPKTENPALGLRGIRYALTASDLLKTQFRAVLRACCFGDIRIMLPMVTSLEEVFHAKEMLHQCAEDLRAEGMALPDRLPLLGVMIETPAAALEADAIARNCDFLSIGTNDLIQYTLAVDRTDALVASLFNPLHPSILKLIKKTAEAANKAQIPVSICGEMASNHRYAAVLIGMGIRELSMPAINIPMVKERIRSLSLTETEHFVNRLLSLEIPADVVRTFNAFEEGARFY
ncbi:MAG: phosphoenolpyruvate--protein phosphotransferase [Alphaproteobacteria bacterium]|nr:phosphoenolpyruvate--protein phosphotransferase [Alphaproteobacteria bacterium]